MPLRVFQTLPGFAATVALIGLCLSVESTSAQAPSPQPEAGRKLVVVSGAGGQASYDALFATWAGQWLDAGAQAGFETTPIGPAVDERSPHEQLHAACDEWSGSEGELWIVLIGHGTFDGNVARFNLVGPDVSAEELAEWLKPREHLTVIVNCASSSAPFATALAGPRRVIVTATSSGFESNFARFGRFMSDAITDSSLDLDKDQQVSLLEAFVSAGSKTREFYESDKRLITEHAMLEDNGDGLGTPADWFRGTRIVVEAEGQRNVDGRLASQISFLPGRPDQQLSADNRARRMELEDQLEQLRVKKKDLSEDEYYRLLEPLMLELARLYFPEGQPN